MIKTITFYFSIALFLISCNSTTTKTDQNVLPTGLQNNETENLSKPDLDEKLSNSAFSGKWTCIDNNESQDYNLNFLIDNDKVSGNHCFIRGEQGDQLDCPDDNSFNGRVVENEIIGKFKSDWVTDSLKCEIQIKSDTLKLKFISDTDVSFFTPEMEFIRSKKD